MTQMTKEQRDLLKPHAEHFQVMAAHVWDASDDDLKALIAACDAASQTNCGWDTYAAAQYLGKEARIVTGQRRLRAAEAAPAHQ